MNKVLDIEKPGFLISTGNVVTDSKPAALSAGSYLLTFSAFSL